LQGRHGLPGTGNRLTILTLEVVRNSEKDVGHRRQADIPADRSEREGSLAGSDGLVICPSVVAIDGLKDQDLPQSPRII
jgi:hypothetical protein